MKLNFGKKMNFKQKKNCFTHWKYDQFGVMNSPTEYFNWLWYKIKPSKAFNLLQIWKISNFYLATILGHHLIKLVARFLSAFSCQFYRTIVCSIFTFALIFFCYLAIYNLKSNSLFISILVDNWTGILIFNQTCSWLKIK